MHGGARVTARINDLTHASDSVTLATQTLTGTGTFAPAALAVTTANDGRYLIRVIASAAA